MNWLKNNPHPTPTGNDPGLGAMCGVMLMLGVASCFMPLSAVVALYEGKQNDALWMLGAWFGFMALWSPFVMRAAVEKFMQWQTANVWWPFQDERECRERLHKNVKELFDLGEPILHQDGCGRPYLHTKVGPDRYEDNYLS